jgi:hypothetical protein
MRLVINRDEAVAKWMFAASGCNPVQFNLAIGLAKGMDLVGGIMFTGYNGSDVEVHFYGPGVLSRRVVRAMMHIAGRALEVNRMTVRTRKPSMARGVVKLGAVYEGKIRRLYGPTDGDEHAGEQYAFFRETILRLAGQEEANPDVWRQ